MRRAILVLGFIVAIFLSLTVKTQAQDCSISSFSLDPGDPYTLGVAVILHGESNCGTVRFRLTNLSSGQVWYKAETGQGSQTETWRTNETGTGTFDVCFEARGNGGWENAARSCRTVYVEGSQPPPTGSQTGSSVRCWVNNFYVTPSSGPVGHRFQLSGQGQCDGNARASRFSIDGAPFGEYGGNTTSSEWQSAGYSVGSHTLCFLVTAGDWSQAAQSCVGITLTDGGSPSNNVASGNPATNGQSPQTDQSNPDSGSTGSGGLDIASYCAAQGQGAPYNQGRDWFCGGSTWQLSMQEICSWQYPGSQAVNADSMNAFGWSCTGGTTSSNSQSASSQTANTDSSNSSNVACSSSYLSIGDIAVVSTANEHINMRQGAGMNFPVMTTIPAGTQLTLIGSAICADGWQWYETQYNGYTGWVAEVSSTGVRNILRNGEAMPEAPSNTAGTQGTSPTAPITDSNCVSQFSVGDVIRSTGPTLWLFSSPQQQATQTSGVDSSVTMSITGPAQCDGSSLFIPVSVSDGRTGWIAEVEWGTRVAVIERVSIANTAQETNVVHIEILSVSISGWDGVPDFQVDPSSCVVLNGSEIVATWLNGFRSWILSVPPEDQLAEAVNFFFPNTGYIEQFRRTALDDVNAATGCQDFRYQVGDHLMDSSGMGNFIYGFALSWIPTMLEDISADLEQGINDRSRFQFSDNPDDQSQRQAGREVGVMVNRGNRVTSAMVEAAANVADLE